MRLLITTMPLRSRITAMPPFAEAAASAGDEVLFATGPDGLDMLRAAGFETAAAGLSSAEFSARYGPLYAAHRVAGRSPGQRLDHLIAHGLVGVGGGAMARALLPPARDWKPDAIVSTLAEPAGRIGAAALGLAHATHAFGSPKAAIADEDHLAAVTLLRSSWEVSAERYAAYRDEPYLDIRPAALRPEATRWQLPNAWPLRPANVMPLPAAERGPRPAVLDALPHARTVCVTIGTTYAGGAQSTLKTMVEALHGEAVNAIATVGHTGDPAELGAQPDHVRVERFIAQDTLLPRCAAVLCHGGAGSVLGALAHGVPLVAVPLASDHHESAALVARSGAGLTCAGAGTGTQPSAEEITHAVRRVRDEPGFRSAAGQAARELALMPAPAQVVERLAGYVEAWHDETRHNAAWRDEPHRG